MRYRTAKNMEQAVRLIMEKGYDEDTAVSIAPRIFTMVKPGTPPAEHFIGLIVPKSESRRVDHDQTL